MKNSAVEKVVESLRSGQQLYQDSFQCFGYLTRDDPERPNRVIKRRVSEMTFDKLLVQKLIVELPPNTSKRRQFRKWYGLTKVATPPPANEIGVAEGNP